MSRTCQTFIKSLLTSSLTQALCSESVVCVAFWVVPEKEGTEHSDQRVTSLSFLYIPVGIVDSFVFIQSQNPGQKCHKGFVKLINAICCR